MNIKELTQNSVQQYASIMHFITEGYDRNLKANGLVGISLRNAYLPDADLAGVDLSGSDFSGTYLSGVNLREAKLLKTAFTRADLAGAKFNCANLTQANLMGADLADAIFYEANLCGANLRGANLAGANFYGSNLTDADLSGAILINASLAYSNLTNAVFRGAYMVGVDLREATLDKTILLGANLDKATMPDGKKYYQDEEAIDMTRWEYQFLTVAYPETLAGIGVVKYINGEEIADWKQKNWWTTEALNDLGKDGWELVDIIWRRGRGESARILDTVYVLKRPIP
jgi:uncharacterized protein YjbI with pentapeptide repeats